MGGDFYGVLTRLVFGRIGNCFFGSDFSFWSWFFGRNLFHRSLSNFFNRCLFYWSLFGRAVLTELLRITDSTFLGLVMCDNPLWQFHAVVLKKFNDTRRWLSTVVEVLLSQVSLDGDFFGVWVKTTNISNH